MESKVRKTREKKTFLKNSGLAPAKYIFFPGKKEKGRKRKEEKKKGKSILEYFSYWEQMFGAKVHDSKSDKKMEGKGGGKKPR